MTYPHRRKRHPFVALLCLAVPALLAAAAPADADTYPSQPVRWWCRSRQRAAPMCCRGWCSTR